MRNIAFFLIFLLLSITKINSQNVIYAEESAASSWTAGDGFNAWSDNPGDSSGKFFGNPADVGIGTTNIGTTILDFMLLEVHIIIFIYLLMKQCRLVKP